MNKFEEILSDALNVDVSKSKAFYWFKKQQLFLATRQTVVPNPLPQKTYQIKQTQTTNVIKLREQILFDKNQRRQVVGLNNKVKQMQMDCRKLTLHQDWRDEKLVVDVLGLVSKELKEERIEKSKLKREQKQKQMEISKLRNEQLKTRYY